MSRIVLTSQWPCCDAAWRNVCLFGYSDLIVSAPFSTITRTISQFPNRAAATSGTRIGSSNSFWVPLGLVLSVSNCSTCFSSPRVAKWVSWQPDSCKEFPASFFIKRTASRSWPTEMSSTDAINSKH